MADGLNTFFQARAYSDFAAMSPERQAKVLPYIATWCGMAANYTAVDAMRALGQVFALREATVAATLPFDYVISPTSPITAYDAEEAAPGNDPQFKSEHIRFTAPFNQSEQPAASICAGYDEDGLPIGLQIVGRRFDDAGVLRMSHIYEQMRPALRAWPEP